MAMVACTTVVMKNVDIMMSPNKTRAAVQIFRSMKGTFVSLLRYTRPTGWQFQGSAVTGGLCLPLADHLADSINLFVFVIGIVLFEQPMVSRSKIWQKGSGEDGDFDQQGWTALTKRIYQQRQATGSRCLVNVWLASNLLGHDLGHPGGRIEEVRKPAHESSDLYLV
jgi:hypothetical protein